MPAKASSISGQRRHQWRYAIFSGENHLEKWQ
jgi:hypothetical protein